MVLWLITGTLLSDVELAKVRFEEKNKVQANVIWVRPDLVGKIKTDLGLEIRGNPYVLRGYFGLGREGNVKGQTS
jgi:hypothetical protein